MNIALWVVQGLLATAFVMAGILKLTKSKAEISENMAWAEDFTENQIKTIGALELLGAIGLILPGITGIAPALVPIAAVGIILIMVGAIVAHVRRSEAQEIIKNVVFIAMAAFIAWGRFGDHPL